jgi:hypothetical protein
MKAIVKVQLPLNDRGAEALIYDQNRRHKVLVPQNPDLLAKMSGTVKAYFHAEWRDGEWVLGKPALRQNW